MVDVPGGKHTTHTRLKVVFDANFTPGVCVEEILGVFGTSGKDDFDKHAVDFQMVEFSFTKILDIDSGDLGFAVNLDRDESLHGRDLGGVRIPLKVFHLVPRDGIC